MACTFQATLGGKFAPLINLRDADIDIDSMIIPYNTALTDTASEILGKECRKKCPGKLPARGVPDLCDERRDWKKRWYEGEGAEQYRKDNKRVQKAQKKAKEEWIDTQCKEIDACLNINNSKKT